MRSGMKPIIRIDSQGFMRVVNKTHRELLIFIFDLDFDFDIAVDYCMRHNGQLADEILKEFKS